MGTFEGKPTPDSNKVYIVSDLPDLKVVISGLDEAKLVGTSASVAEFMDFLEKAFDAKDYKSLPGCLFVSSTVAEGMHYSTAIIEVVNRYKKEGWVPNVIALSNTEEPDDATKKQLGGSLGLEFHHFLGRERGGMLPMMEIHAAINRGAYAGVSAGKLPDAPFISEKYANEAEEVELTVERTGGTLRGREVKEDKEDVGRLEQEAEMVVEEGARASELIMKLEPEKKVVPETSAVGVEVDRDMDDFLETTSAEEEVDGLMDVPRKQAEPAGEDYGLNALADRMRKHEEKSGHKRDEVLEQVERDENGVTYGAIGGSAARKIMEESESVDPDSMLARVGSADVERKAPAEERPADEKQWMSKKTDTTRQITIGAAKRGVGVSTVAVNMAVHYARASGARVCLIEYAQQSMTQSLLTNMMSAPTILSGLKKIDNLNTSNYRDVVNEHSSGVGFIFAPRELEKGEVLRTRHYERIYSVIKDIYDVVIWDVGCDPRFEDDYWPYEQGNPVIFVAEPTRDSIFSTAHMVAYLEELKYVKPDRVCFVINKMVDETHLDPDYIQDMFRATDYNAAKGEGKHLILGTIPSNYQWMVKMYNMHQIPVMSDKENPITKAMKDVAENACPVLFSDGKKRKKSPFRGNGGGPKDKKGGSITDKALKGIKRLKGDQGDA